MRATKKRSLKAKSWKLGTASEFLEISAEETAYVEMRLRLADPEGAAEMPVVPGPRQTN